MVVDKNCLKFDTFLLHGHIGPTLGSKPWPRDHELINFDSGTGSINIKTLQYVFLKCFDSRKKAFLNFNIFPYVIILAPS